MKAFPFHLVAVFALVLAQTGGAQMTNFVPRQPPRAYNAVVRLHDVELDSGIARTEDAEHAFIPNMGSQMESTQRDGPAVPQARGPVAARKKPRDAQSAENKPAATVDEIIAGGGRGTASDVREGSVAEEFLKQQALTRAAAVRDRAELADKDVRDAEHDEFSRRNAAAHVSENRDSLWLGSDDLAKYAAAQLKTGDAETLFTRSRNAVDSYSRSARDEGGAAGDGSFQASVRGMPALEGAAYAKPRDALSGSGGSIFFGDSRAMQAYGAQSAPAGDGLFQQQDNSQPRVAPVAPARSFGAGGSFGVDDFKKPTTLPW